MTGRTNSRLGAGDLDLQFAILAERAFPDDEERIRSIGNEGKTLSLDTKEFIRAGYLGEIAAASGKG